MELFVDIHTHRPAPGVVTPPAAGIHPWEAQRLARIAPEALADAIPSLDEARVIGEIGLDFARGPERDVQLHALRLQLRLARERRLPVVLHCVRAFEPMMRELADCPPPAVIFHGFIGSPEQARQALGRGYWLSFGIRAFASPKTLRALRETPLAQLFLETDDDATPIGQIYDRAAAVLGLPAERLQRATLDNYQRIFGKQ